MILSQLLKALVLHYKVPFIPINFVVRQASTHLDNAMATQKSILHDFGALLLNKFQVLNFSFISSSPTHSTGNSLR